MLKNLTFKHWVVGILVLVLSFITTLWLTEPEVPPEGMIKSLASAAVSDEASLNAAARAAGLQYSSYVRSSIDSLTRVDASHVGISGWAVETLAAIEARGAPITVMVFGAGRRIFSVQTKGERPDVASALNLSEETSKSRSGKFLSRMNRM